MREFEESGTGPTASVRRVGTILAVVVVAAVIVFSLGVMVGKRVTVGGQSLSEPPSALPTENLRPRPVKEAEEKAQSGLAPEPQGAKSGKDPQQADKLTFFDTLAGDKAAAPPVLPKEKDPPVKKADLAKKVEPKKEPPKKAPPPPPKKKAAGPEARVMAMTGAGQFHVQLASTTNSDWAADLVRRLAKKGLDAESTTVMLKGKSWYRVRVGAFPDRETAQKALDILKGAGQDGMVVRGE